MAVTASVRVALVPRSLLYAGCFALVLAARTHGEGAGPLEQQLALGRKALEAREYGQAIDAFERALKLSPTSAEATSGISQALTGLGVEFANSGEIAKSRAALERALRHADESVAYLGLGYLDYLEGKDAAARDHLDRALRADPKEARAHRLLAYLEYRSGSTAKALERIDASCRLDPSDKESQELKRSWSQSLQVLSALTLVRGEHFQIHLEKSFGPAATGEVVALLETIRGAIGESLGAWPRRVVTVVLPFQKSFRSIAGPYHWVGGVYDGQIKAPVELGDEREGASRTSLARTLRHEYAHVVVKEIAPGCPNWLNEGIAQHFETLDDPKGVPVDVKQRAARLKQRRAVVDAELRKHLGRKIPLGRMPSKISEVADEGLARLSYLEGLSFVLFLVDEHGAFRLRVLLHSVAKEPSLGLAFEASYGASLDEIERRWWSSVSAAGG